MKRIIGLGNRWVPEDSAGPAVCDLLAKRALPDTLSVVDGGLAGLDLLRMVEGTERVVFVDRVVQGPHPDALADTTARSDSGLGVWRLEAGTGPRVEPAPSTSGSDPSTTDEAPLDAPPRMACYGHDGGAEYLLRVLPAVLDGPMPELWLVGVTRKPSRALVARAAEVAVGVALRGGDAIADGAGRSLGSADGGLP